MSLVRLWFSFLKEQLYIANVIEHQHEDKQERVYNFIHVPFQLEKLILFGYFICMNSFVYFFTILPLRLVYHLAAVFYALFSLPRGTSRWSLWSCIRKWTSLRRLQQCVANHSEAMRVDLLKVCLILVSSLLLHYVDPSRLYHSIRGQSIVKLYVIFNVCEVADKLCCSFGLDLLHSFFTSFLQRGTYSDRSLSSLPNRHLRPVTYFILSVAYIVIHTVIHFYQVVTLNVAINSSNNALFTLLISNQFVEIKSAVFKKFEKENLFQLSCSEMVERFQISVFIMLIGFRNILEISGGGLNWDYVLEGIMIPLLVILLSEVVVDWLKHSFITKFNGIVPDVYSTFIDILCKDYARASFGKMNLIPLRNYSMSTRIGFSSLPLCCLVIRVVIQAASVSEFVLTWQISLFLALLYIGLLLLKLTLDVLLSWFIMSRTKETTLNEMKESESASVVKVPLKPGPFQQPSLKHAHLAMKPKASS